MNFTCKICGKATMHTEMCKKCEMARVRSFIAGKPKTCQICGKEFYSSAPASRTCSKECSRELSKRTIRRREIANLVKQASRNKGCLSFDQIPSEQLIRYGKVQEQFYQEDLRVVVPKGLLSYRERIKK